MQIVKWEDDSRRKTCAVCRYVALRMLAEETQTAQH